MDNLGALILVGAISVVAGGAAGRSYVPALLRCGFGRRNYQGRTIATAGGLWLLFAAGAWLFLAWGTRGMPSAVLFPQALPLATAVLGYGLLGLADDLWGTPEFKGLRGHLRALRQGRLTTGLCKAVGGLLLAVGLAVWLQSGTELRVISSTGVIALTANLFNLLDLRPLRALKLFWLILLLQLSHATPFMAVVAGLSVPYGRLEARRVIMLGDTGANALGGLAGVLLVLHAPLVVEILVLTALVAFHVWAEKHSLSGWIDRRPWARAIDQWGWSTKGETGA